MSVKVLEDVLLCCVVDYSLSMGDLMWKMSMRRVLCS